MQIVDLSHEITQKMPVYQGTRPPQVEILATYSTSDFQETGLCLTSHTGTHLDAPRHFFAAGASLEQLPLCQFMGSATVIDCKDTPDLETISSDQIKRSLPDNEKVDFLLFHTGWDRFWGTKRYFVDYPYLDHSAVSFILANQIKGIGLDTISPDGSADEKFTVHRRLLAAGTIVIVENLTNLDQLPAGVFDFAAFPLKYENADGSPVRAVAILNAGD